MTVDFSPSVANSRSRAFRNKANLCTKVPTNLYDCALGGIGTHETDLYQARGQPDAPPGRPDTLQHAQDHIRWPLTVGLQCIRTVLPPQVCYISCILRVRTFVYYSMVCDTMVCWYTYTSSSHLLILSSHFFFLLPVPRPTSDPGSTSRVLSPLSTAA